MKKYILLIAITLISFATKAQDIKNGHWTYDGAKTDEKAVIKSFDFVKGVNSLFIFEYDGLFIKKYGSGKVFIQDGYLKFRVMNGYGIHKKKDTITHQYKLEVVDDNHITLTLEGGELLKYTRTCE